MHIILTDAVLYLISNSSLWRLRDSFIYLISWSLLLICQTLSLSLSFSLSLSPLIVPLKWAPLLTPHWSHQFPPLALQLLPPSPFPPLPTHLFPLLPLRPFPMCSRLSDPRWISPPLRYFFSFCVVSRMAKIFEFAIGTNENEGFKEDRFVSVSAIF